MPRRGSREARGDIEDFRHNQARRTNNPPAGLSSYEQRERQTRAYAYDPHLDPQLVWAGKAEHTSFEVDVVPLHIHEWVSTKAILRAVQRPEPIQFELFGETPLPADKQVEFYQHEVGWVNRLILGDSLLVMNSLLVKEGMAGKVQMIYMDPPYGIKYASNFQPRIDRRDVKDKDEDLTHEPEQIKAYRDTWKLGIHSYLTYLRDRLLLCRELLHDSGSIFVQVNDENMHLVRCLLDEVFGRENFVAVVAFRKTGGLIRTFLPGTFDFLLCYAKKKELLKWRRLFVQKAELPEAEERYQYCELLDGSRISITEAEGTQYGRAYKLTSLDSAGNPVFPFDYHGRSFFQRWKTSEAGLQRLSEADRLSAGRTLLYVRYYDDFPVVPLTDIWSDTRGEMQMFYAVQTAVKVIERCILMTTDPGDLVFDPTCGSGTTAYCAEKWGRRWITCDTSRVALAIARQRLMTARFDYYELRAPERGPAGGFIYETVPHITLESIAKNTEIDAIAAKYQSHIDRALAELNAALKGKPVRIKVTEGGRAGQLIDFSSPDTATFTMPNGQTVKINELLEWEVPREVPHPVWPKEAQEAYWDLYKAKQRMLDVDQEYVAKLLQTVYQLTGHSWESLDDVPDPVPGLEWPEQAKEALRRFWELKRKKRQEIDESIRRNAPQEVLYDRPKVKRGVVRVTGPFTVEAIPVPSVEDPTKPSAPQEEEEVRARVNDRGGDYIATMIAHLKRQGSVLFTGGKRMELHNIRQLSLGYLHAEAETQQNGQTLRVAISFGPQYGPVTPVQVQEAIPTAKLNGYNVLLLAGFSFDPEAQALPQKAPVVGLQVYFVNVSPDVLVEDLKTTRASQIFTVFGQPDVRVQKREDGSYVVELHGVDIYDPLTGEVHSARGEDVAAWFLDTDYDGKTFHICQAFFPYDKDAWEKLQRALKAYIPAEAFDKMSGTVSFPFKPGEYKRIAVKVIDFRGNEVIKVLPLERG